MGVFSLLIASFDTLEGGYVIADQFCIPPSEDAAFKLRIRTCLSGLACRQGGGGREDSAVLQVEEVPTKRMGVQSRGGLAPVIIEGAETAVLRGTNHHAVLGKKS